MPVALILSCGGCEATTRATGPLCREFHGLSGGTSGFGKWKLVDPQTLTPEGWIMFDPYTQATYCPTCWAKIEAEPE